MIPDWYKLKEIALQQNVTIGCAESLTGGLLGGYIAQATGASGYFKGTLCAYDIHTKVELLGVSGTHASEVNCVSAQVAREMAQGACELFGSTYGVSTTGYAETKPPDVPHAYWCVYRDQKVVAEGRMEMAWLVRHEAQQQVAYKVLEKLVEIMEAT